MEKFRQNVFIIKDSSFSNSLNSIFKIKSDLLPNQKDTIIDSQFYAGSNVYYSTVSFMNCCFFNCSDSIDQQDGGAISIHIPYCNLIVTQTLFSRCNSLTIGGAIFNLGHGFNITTSEFADCESTDTGGAIFSNTYKRYGDGYANIGLFHSQVLNTQCNYLPLDVNASHMSCTNCNFSNNRNNFHSNPTDARQQSFGFTFLTTSNNQKFKYVNYIGNDGDCVMEITFKAYLDISSVNVINNVNLNFFFYNDPDGPQSSESGVDHKIVCLNFAFFGNQKSSLTDRIKVANALVSYQFSLVNCFFDYSSSELNLMLNGHVESNSQCSMSTTMVVHSDVLAQWYYCTIPSSIFTLSSVFTETSIFSETSQFSKSITFSMSSHFTGSSTFSMSSHFSGSSTFSESSHFSGSSTFSESLTFSESSTFSESLTFSDSEIFFELPSFVNSFLFTDKFLTQSMPFTPSSYFTPSNFFTPNRTKIPDPQDIFHKPDVSGRKNVFTKEELKKAAGPVSISLALIIIAIVCMLLYLRRKIYEIRHQESAPDFDTSLNDEVDSDSEYSYSYYTYEYYYETQYEYSYYSNEEDAYEYSTFDYDTLTYTTYE